jgi:hypothetical protein
LTSSPFGIVPPVTVAVNVTGCPTNVGDPEVASVVFVGNRILSVSVADLLPSAVLRTPEYEAVIECVPELV